MASNQNVNKVVYAGTTLIDLTGDDVTAASVLSGKKFHLPSGAAATGTIATKTASNLSASGATVTVPAGYYASQATKAVASGSVTAPASITGSSASVSAISGGIKLSKTLSVTPSVTTAGYISSGTARNSTIELSASLVPYIGGSAESPYLTKGYIALATGKTGASSAGKYYRTAYDSPTVIPQTKLLLLCGISNIQWTGWTYSAPDNPTRSLTNNQYISSTMPIVVPYSSTDKYFALSFRKPDESAFSDSEVSNLQYAITYLKLS